MLVAEGTASEQPNQLPCTEISQRLLQALICWVSVDGLFEGLANRIPIADGRMYLGEHHPGLGELRVHIDRPLERLRRENSRQTIFSTSGLPSTILKDRNVLLLRR